MKTLIGVAVGLLAASALAASPALAGDAAAGAKLYTEHKCDKCHGMGGKGDGDTAQKLKISLEDWTQKETQAKMMDKDLMAIIQKGGKAVGKSPKMPPYGSKLSEAQVGDLVAYIRSLAK